MRPFSASMLNMCPHILSDPDMPLYIFSHVMPKVSFPQALPVM